MNQALLQYAGEIGLASLGVGKEFSRYSIAGLYGIVPSEMSGGPLIETVTVRQTYSFYDWKRMTFYGGLNIFHVLGISYESSEYGDAPKSYYPIGSIRGLVNLGFALTTNVKETRQFYFEAGLNDIWIVNWLSNNNVVNPGEHVSLGLGIKQRF